MLKVLEGLAEYIHGRSHPELAKLCAYLVAPAIVISFAIVGSDGQAIGFDLIGPMTVTPLQSEVSVDGLTRKKMGVAFVVEPTAAELRIPVDGALDRIWTSLSQSALLANRDHLHLDGGGIISRTPFIGVSTPVAVVLEGDLGSEVQTLGGSEHIENWVLPTRRSVSIVSSVLLACVFAFGMAFTAAVPIRRGNQDARREIRT